jgi:hypothetical protein
MHEIPELSIETLQWNSNVDSKYIVHATFQTISSYKQTDMQWNWIDYFTYRDKFQNASTLLPSDRAQARG